MANRLKIGVIGVGHLGKAHVRVLSEMGIGHEEYDLVIALDYYHRAKASNHWKDWATCFCWTSGTQRPS